MYITQWSSHHLKSLYHQNCLDWQQIGQVCCMSPRMVWRQRHLNWSSQASQHPKQLRVHPSQITHHSCAQPIKQKIHYSTKSVTCSTKQTRVSASRKTHFEYSVSVQQCNLVNVIPNSGLARTAKLALSPESRKFTTLILLQTSDNHSLKIRMVIKDNRR